MSAAGHEVVGSVVADRLVETHLSRLEFHHDIVRKLKKPVDYGFADFTTPERRLDGCAREVALNRRLAADVYLGVEEVRDSGGRLLDAAVLMRRLPDERRLASLATAGADLRGQLRAIAHLLVAFHSRTGTGPGVAQMATADALRRRWLADLAEMDRFADDILDHAGLSRARNLALRYIEGRQELFEQRIAAGFARDGHGDLLAEDIFCLDDGPRILDCLEFDDSLRYGDVLADVAFLAMDLEHLGRADSAQTFINAYAELSGSHHPASLLHLYIAHRALVRAKVACLRAEQGLPGGDREARAYMRQCLRHLDLGRIVLLMLGGLPGSGKTTVATRLAADLGWVHLRSDEVRHDVAGLSRAAHQPAAFQEGIYRPLITHLTYTELLNRASKLLRQGEAVIVDATFRRDQWRSAARALASAAHADLVEIRCVAPKAELWRRLRARAGSESDLSDATPDIVRRLAAGADRWPEALVLDTTPRPNRTLARALRYIGEAPASVAGAS